MVLTGVRTVELHGLRWSDFDFDKRLIHIRRNGLSSDGFCMGPNDSMVTLEVYSHFIPDTQEKVVFALNNISKKMTTSLSFNGNLTFPASWSPSATIRLCRIDEPRTNP